MGSQIWPHGNPFTGPRSSLEDSYVLQYILCNVFSEHEMMKGKADKRWLIAKHSHEGDQVISGVTGEVKDTAGLELPSVLNGSSQRKECSCQCKTIMIQVKKKTFPGLTVILRNKLVSIYFPFTTLSYYCLKICILKMQPNEGQIGIGSLATKTANVNFPHELYLKMTSEKIAHFSKAITITPCYVL